MSCTSAARGSQALLRLLALACLLALSMLLGGVQGASVDDNRLLPVRVRVWSDGLGASYFPSVDGDGNAIPASTYLAQYRAGILSFARDIMSAPLDDEHIPLSGVTRTTSEPDAARNQTVWTFQVVHLMLAPDIIPLDVYSAFEGYCQRQDDGNCLPLGSYEYYVAMDPVVRKWLFYSTSVNVMCCDDTYERTLQDCPVCGSLGFKQFAMVMGLVGGFIGLVLLFVAWKIWRRKGLERRAARWKQQQQGKQPPGRSVADAGHAPPPSNIGPAFDVRSPSGSTPHHTHPHQPQQAFAQRPQMAAHMQPPPPPTVVVKVHTAKHKTREEPDADSSPIASEHDRPHKHKQKSARAS